MLPLVYYLIKVIICAGILFGYYWFLLRNKIFHKYNRFYLLSLVCISLITPLVHIKILHKATTSDQTIKILQIINNPDSVTEIIINSSQNTFTTDHIILALYCFTSFVFLTFFVSVLLKIRRLLKKFDHNFIQQICVLNTSEKGTPFSFLKYIFWNNEIDISTATGSQIFKHEMAHVEQKHSYDKLFINAVLILFWWNPFFWLVRKELNMIHEFMADKIAVEDCNTTDFAAMILQATYPGYQFPLTNSFFYSPIKRRLMMLTKNKNSKSGYLARVLVLPVAVMLFAAFTFKAKSIKNDLGAVYTGKKLTVVIDAGHGGSDFGAAGVDGITLEKDIVLSIVKKIKTINNNENIDIILTRHDDSYQSPPEKVEFSKAHHADLFISFHVGAETLKSEKNMHSGMSVWVARDNFKNASASKLFASAIIQEFKQDYKLPVLVEFPQQRQRSVGVLQQNDCPAVLIETGFITNNIDLAYLQTEAAKVTIAKNVLTAIEKYASQHNDRSVQMRADTIFIDTVPKAIIKNTATKKDNNLPDNKLYVLNGKIIGKGKIAAVQINKLVENKYGDQTIQSINVITVKEVSLKKYGLQGKDGVIEITTVSKENGKITIKKPITDNLTFNQDSVQDTKVFTRVETEATFPGGSTGWFNYYKKNMDDKLPAQDHWKNGPYVVIVTFIVKKDGSLTDIKTDTYPESKTAQACINLIKKGPRWIPARQNNQIVAAYRKETFSFMVAD